ncbi:MAG TPA: hypothetical protein VFK05_11585 [Polyangiaceae bacterium]|nr:hypothetical protein [Polyangiaceae bacterium]
MFTTIRKVSVVGFVALAAISAFAISAFEPKASAQTAPGVCGEKEKEEIAKLLTNPVIQQDPGSEKALALEAQIYAKYSACAADGVDGATVPPAKSAEYCGRLRYLGYTNYEHMQCCGYDPQKKLFGCPVEVVNKVGFGPFGPAPKGSYEHVLTCVDYGFGAGFQPAALDRVHLSDAQPIGGSPPWEFAVIAAARGLLRELPLDGRVLPARSILSWGFTPNSCNYKPYWGDVIDYQIRLDP